MQERASDLGCLVWRLFQYLPTFPPLELFQGPLLHVGNSELCAKVDSGVPSLPEAGPHC